MAARSGSGIFISYRREDASGHAGRLYDHLAARFGDDRVFMDVESIVPGTDFVVAIEGALERCHACIVLIGPAWLSASDDEGRHRLEQPDDFVRFEIETAMERSLHVIPVLLWGAAMPAQDQLPPTLAALTRLQALDVSDRRWRADTTRLVDLLDRLAPSPSRPAKGGGLNDRVATVVNDIVGLARSAGEPELVELLNAEARLWGARESTLVVVGETKRGKSSLINALLDIELLPTGPSAVTSTYLVLRDSEEPMALVHIDGRQEPLPVAFEEVADWATAGGAGTSGAPVRAVELCIPHPLLATGLMLVDTPGVGGLDASHARVTLATLTRADAVIFVVDPSAPLSEPELRFLDVATERIETVLFVMTKTDLFRGWERVLDDDRELLFRRAPRLADSPVIPVSNRLKAVADGLAREGHPDDELLEESGFPRLTSELRALVIGRTALLRLANLLRVSQFAVGRLQGTVQASIQATEGEREAEELVARVSAELDELKDAAERAGIVINDRFNLLREAAQAELGRKLREVSERYERDTEGAPKEQVLLVSAVQAELAAVDAELTAMIDAEVHRIVGEVAVLVDVTSLALESSSPGGGNVDLGALLAGRRGAQGDPSARLRIASTLASAGTSVGFLSMRVADYPILAAILGLGALVGIATSALGVRIGRRQRDLQAFRSNLRSALEAARSEVAPLLRQRILAQQRQIEGQLRTHMRATTRTLQRSAGEGQRLQRADAAARQQARAEAEQRLAALHRSTETVRELSEEVSGRLRSSVGSR